MSNEDDQNAHAFAIVAAAIIAVAIMLRICVIEGKTVGNFFNIALIEARAGHFYSSPPLSSNACRLSVKMLTAAGVSFQLEPSSSRGNDDCREGTIITVTGLTFDGLFASAP
jgi:hypothetical protein